MEKKMKLAQELTKKERITLKAREFLQFHKQRKDLGENFTGEGILQNIDDLSDGDEDFEEELIKELGYEKNRKRR